MPRIKRAAKPGRGRCSRYSKLIATYPLQFFCDFPGGTKRPAHSTAVRPIANPGGLLFLVMVFGVVLGTTTGAALALGVRCRVDLRICFGGGGFVVVVVVVVVVFGEGGEGSTGLRAVPGLVRAEDLVVLEEVVEVVVFLEAAIWKCIKF